MSKSASSSAALPIAHAVLRILVVANWLMGAAILALLVALPNRQWVMSAFDLSPSADTDRLVVPLNYAVLKRLLAMVDTVRAGDPFVPANARRLQAIAWSLLALQLLSIVIGAIARSV